MAKKQDELEQDVIGTAKTRTPEEQAALDAKRKARNEARERIVKFLKDNADQLGSLKADIESFIGRAQVAPRAAVRTINSDLRDAFLAAHEAGKGLSEMDIFRQFKIGRPEMVTKARILVLCPNPADRVWVKFHEDEEAYYVEGLGAEPPAGWEGYVPSSKVDNL